MAGRTAGAEKCHCFVIGCFVSSVHNAFIACSPVVQALMLLSSNKRQDLVDRPAMAVDQRNRARNETTAENQLTKKVAPSLHFLDEAVAVHLRNQTRKKAAKMAAKKEIAPRLHDFRDEAKAVHLRNQARSKTAGSLSWRPLWNWPDFLIHRNRFNDTNFEITIVLSRLRSLTFLNSMGFQISSNTARMTMYRT
jgi:hypothetical protein